MRAVPCTDLLFPRDVLKSRRPDEHFALKARAASDLDIKVHLVDHLRHLSEWLWLRGYESNPENVYPPGFTDFAFLRP